MCRSPPAYKGQDEVRVALASILGALVSMRKAGLAHGRLSPEYMVFGEFGLLERLVSARGGNHTLALRTTSGAWQVMPPATQNIHEGGGCAHDGEATTMPGAGDCCCTETGDCCASPRRARTGSVDPRLWYRTPEEQVCSVEEILCSDRACRSRRPCAHAADIWACGCVFAEMTTGVPLFEFAETQFDLLGAHCDYLGFKYSSDALDIRSDETMTASATLRQLVPPSSMCDCGFNLLSRMLSCDWRARITAEEALAHPFFSCGCETTVAAPALSTSSRPTTVGLVDAEGRSDDDEDGAVYSSFVGGFQNSADGLAPMAAQVAILVKEHKRKRGLADERCTDPCPSLPGKRRCVAPCLPALASI